MRFLNSFSLFAFLFLGLFIVSCGGDASQSTTEENSTPETETEASDNGSDAKYQISPFASSPQYADAKIESMKYENGKFSFGIGGDSYKLGVQTSDAPKKMCANSDKGQHIHLIVDNEPYAAKYESDFDYDLEDGAHFILAFLSRSYHESIKTKDAHVVKYVNIENKAIQGEKEINKPMLFYSRPKGTYVGKANTEKVMLDFYVANVELGDDYKVLVNINGEEKHTIDVWQPYYIEGLPMGDNKITLTLLDGTGNVVDVPLNPVERVFTLKEDPIENVE